MFEIELSTFNARILSFSLLFVCFFSLDDLCQTTPSDWYIQSRVQLAILFNKISLTGFNEITEIRKCGSPLGAVSRPVPVPWELLEPLLSVINKTPKRFECSIPFSLSSLSCNFKPSFFLSRRATMSTTPSAWYIQFCVQLPCFTGYFSPGLINHFSISGCLLFRRLGSLVGIFVLFS